MSNYFFTSDSHWFHNRIIEYSDRPFSSVEEMNEIMVQNWNSVVTKHDIVWHMGDFALCNMKMFPELQKIFNRLNGQKNIVWGNHDEKSPVKKLKWGITDKIRDIKVNKQKIVLCHFPFKTWNKSHKGSWNFHGHSHCSLPPDPDCLQLDVGVDCHNFTPVSFDQVKEIMDNI